MADDDDVTPGELIRRKRARGYDAEFEALLARRWLCAACTGTSTVLEHVWINGLPCCPHCDLPEIDPVEPASPALTVVPGGKR